MKYFLLVESSVIDFKPMLRPNLKSSRQKHAKGSAGKKISKRRARNGREKRKKKERETSKTRAPRGIFAKICMNLRTDTRHIALQYD